MATASRQRDPHGGQSGDEIGFHGLGLGNHITLALAKGEAVVVRRHVRPPEVVVADKAVGEGPLHAASPGPRGLPDLEEVVVGLAIEVGLIRGEQVVKEIGGDTAVHLPQVLLSEALAVELVTDVGVGGRPPGPGLGDAEPQDKNQGRQSCP